MNALLSAPMIGTNFFFNVMNCVTTVESIPEVQTPSTFGPELRKSLVCCAAGSKDQLVKVIFTTWMFG